MNRTMSIILILVVHWRHQNKPLDDRLFCISSFSIKRLWKHCMNAGKKEECNASQLLLLILNASKFSEESINYWNFFFFALVPIIIILFHCLRPWPTLKYISLFWLMLSCEFTFVYIINCYFHAFPKLHAEFLEKSYGLFYISRYLPSFARLLNFDHYSNKSLYMK